MSRTVDKLGFLFCFVLWDFLFEMMFVCKQFILRTHFISCDLSQSFPVCLQSVFQYAVPVCTFPSLLTMNSVANKVK